MLTFALLRAIEIVGEAAARVSAPTREAAADIPWGLIVSMRNRLIHAYFDIDHEIVWKAATEELPQLLPQVARLDWKRWRRRLMPLPRQEVDATTPKYLRDKYAIAGVGETTYTRGSGKTTRALGTWAVRNAILDAGLKRRRHRRHSVLFGRRLDLGDVHRRRPGHPPQLLHGRGRRRLVDRGPGRYRHRFDRSRLLQDGSDSSAR